VRYTTEYLKSCLLANSGGAPNVYPIDEFEVGFSLVYFLDAGFSPSDPILAPALQKLIQLWEARNGVGLGYSSDFTIDSDDTAHALHVLHQIGYKVNPEVLYPFFNGQHMTTYPEERKASISANLSTLITLKQFNNSPKNLEMINTISNFLEQSSREEGAIFEDKWHYSPVYIISRGVLSFENVNERMFQRCFDWLIANQRADGGWGYHGYSTDEETSYACLALSRCFKKGYKVPSFTLKQAQSYYSAQLHQPECQLWIGKTLYAPTNVIASLKLAAQYSLNDAIDLIRPLPRSSSKVLILNYEENKVQLTSSISFDMNLSSISAGY